MAVVMAVAGRRVDAADAKTPRFPLENVPAVDARLDELLAREGATALVSSAACGADLVALTVAGRRGLRRRVVLPFAPMAFRTSSVTDRPGDWGPIFDRVMFDLDRLGDVVSLEGRGDGDQVYLAANGVILAEAEALARSSGIESMAVLIWEGSPRGEGDVTAAFGAAARARGWRVADVRTL
jgi:hypothetical protein